MSYIEQIKELKSDIRLNRNLLIKERAQLKKIREDIQTQQKENKLNLSGFVYPKKTKEVVFAKEDMDEQPKKLR